ncbi:MAG TPA: M23 family metallopeptidase [Allosphingosinicella sp.]|nr:M23 family metallopeptidase [Allosphingosinicella sp.]
MIVVDLAEEIGSPRWYRGLATCLGLCSAAIALAPPLDPLVAATPAPLSEAQMREAAALAFDPLGKGAGTGRRMAPTEAVVPLRNVPERPRVELTALLGQGYSLSQILIRSGASDKDAAEAELVLSQAIELNAVRPGTPVAITLGKRAEPSAPRPLERLAFRARLDVKVEIVRSGSELVLTQTPIAIDETPLRIRGAAGMSLYRSARAMGVPAKAVEAYLRAIASQIDVASLDPGDRFDMIIEHRRAATGESEAGGLLYAGLARASGQKLQLMQWGVGGKVQWFEASGFGKESGGLLRPVPGSVSSSFGMRRHPILGYSRFHRGMDFRAGYGTPIVAVTDGQVAAAGWAGGYGQQVRLNHSGGLVTSYSHLSRIAAAPGQIVRRGQVIGYVGSTGLSTGPHLHYELYLNGVPVNPLSVRYVQRSQLGGDALAQFQSRLKALLAIPAGAKTFEVDATAP